MEDESNRSVYRHARRPGISVSDLVLGGFLEESEVESDGSVNEQTRSRAEQHFVMEHTPRRRPRTSHIRRRRFELNEPIVNINPIVIPTLSLIEPRIEPQMESRMDPHCTTTTDISDSIQTEDTQLLLCCVCYHNQRQFAMIPCFHFCVCNACSLRLTECPLCRTHIERRQRIWL
jgi:hypothetical protein